MDEVFENKFKKILNLVKNKNSALLKDAALCMDKFQIKILVLL